LEWTEDKQVEIKKDTQKEVLKELKRATAEKLPQFSSMFDDVYSEMTPNLKEQRDE